MFEEELKNDIFANSPIGATMQDGSKRERSTFNLVRRRIKIIETKLLHIS